MRYRNMFGVQGSYRADNPGHYRRRRHRNPDVDLRKWISPDRVVDGLVIGTGYLLSEHLTSEIKLSYNVATGTPIDLMKQGVDFISHIGVGIAGAVLLDLLKQREAGERFAAGAFAAAATKVVANLHILPERILAPGSLNIAHSLPAPNPVPTPMDVRANTWIPPVQGL